MDRHQAALIWLLKQHLPRGAKLRTAEVKELFLQMRDHAGCCPNLRLPKGFEPDSQ
jgi:hypothetical protein